MSKSDFEKVAAQMERTAGRVGAPWSGGPHRPGVAGTVEFPAGSGVIVPERTVFKGNSYFSLAHTDMAQNMCPAGVATTFERKPQRPFVPLQFMAVSWIDDLLIQQISINNTNYMAHANSSGLPIALLSEVSQAMGILWRKISTSSGLSITVFNPTGGALPFLAGFAGVQLDEE